MMTCPECQNLIGQAEMNAAVGEHLAVCGDCRRLWHEREADRHVLRAMGLQTRPAAPKPDKPAYPWWRWSSAAAALILTASGAWYASRPAKAPQIVSIDVNVTGVVPRDVPIQPAEIPAKLALAPPAAPAAEALIEEAEPLLVKMLTVDPDVVIYWLVDGIRPKEE